MRAKIKNTFSLWICLFICTNLYCQPLIQDTKETYNYLAKHSGIESIYTNIEGKIESGYIKSTSHEEDGVNKLSHGQVKTVFHFFVNNIRGFIVIFFYLLFGFLIGVFTLFLYSKMNIYSILSNEKHKYLEDLKNSNIKYELKYLGLILVLKKSKDEKKKEIVDLKNEIAVLRKEIDTLKEGQYKKEKAEPVKIANDIKIINDQLDIIEEKGSEKIIEWNIESEDEKVDVIYFTIPENDGSFKTTNGKNTKEMDCFYKIEANKNNQKGKLFFISSNFDLRALDNIDYYLNPVCEIENISERTKAQRIKMEKPGFVSLIGETWKIDSNNKVIVKLI